MEKLLYHFNALLHLCFSKVVNILVSCLDESLDFIDFCCYLIDFLNLFLTFILFYNDLVWLRQLLTFQYLLVKTHKVLCFEHLPKFDSSFSLNPQTYHRLFFIIGVCFLKATLLYSLSSVLVSSFILSYLILTSSVSL